MRRVRLLAVATGICLLGTALVSISPAAAAGSSITVTPSTDLMSVQNVHVDGTGWPASVELGVCEGVVNGTADLNDCASGGALINTSPTGTMQTDLVVKRTVFIPSLGRKVDCTLEACYVGVSVFSDIAGTVQLARITFDTGLADGRIKRRSDGVISGDDVYDTGSTQGRRHPIAPGGEWTYALQVQNDSPTTADLTVTAGTESNDGLSPAVHFFVGYYDITSSVLGAGGFTFTNVAPGEVITFALQFQALPEARVGSQAQASVGFSSGAAGLTDRLGMFVDVQAPT